MYMNNYPAIDINKVFKRKSNKKKNHIDILIEYENSRLRKINRIFDNHINNIKKFKQIWNLPYQYSPLMIY